MPADPQPGRVAMLAADGSPLGWTYDAVQYELVREALLAGLQRHAGPDGAARLKDLVAFAQEQLGDHPRFPSGRLTNATRYVAADLQGRGLLERLDGSGPQRLRLLEDRP